MIEIASSTMQRMSHVWRQSHLTLTTQLRVYKSIVVPIFLYVSDTWTHTSVDLVHLQAFHMRCQCRPLNVCWYEWVTNVFVSSRRNLIRIGTLIAAWRYTLFGHVVMSANIPCNMALRMCKNMSVKRCIQTSWKRPRGSPRSPYISQWLCSVEAGAASL